MYTSCRIAQAFPNKMKRFNSLSSVKMLLKTPYTHLEPSSKVQNSALRSLTTTAACSDKLLDKLVPRYDDFSRRHIGPTSEDIESMLELVGVKVISFIIYCYSDLFGLV